MPDDVFPSISRYIVQKNDIIVSIVGTIGALSLVDDFYENASLTENCVKLTGLGYHDALYLYYYLSSSRGQHEISKGTVGAVQPKLPIYNIEKIRVLWPSDSEVRQCIATFLATLDDKIDVNHRINQTLDAMAQAIFKSWFVDFDPVKVKIAAKAQGRDPLLAAMSSISGKPASELDALPPEQHAQLAATAALFPDEMVESELGEIPRGWAHQPLSRMVNLIGGGTPKRSEAGFWNGTIPWFSVKDAPADQDVFVVDTAEHITDEGLRKSATRVLPVGVTIISARGTVGRLALVGTPMAMNQSCYGVQGIEGIGPYFNYFNLKTAIDALKQNTHGAVFDTITQATFDTVNCVSPCSVARDAFEAAVGPLLSQIKQNLIETRTLVELRDTLLPKLLSGELQVQTIEAGAAA